jgi:hypothetical protein
MTITEFKTKWDDRFANNESFEITAADLREFKDDLADLLLATGGQGQGLTELVLPAAVAQGGWYLTPTGIWEARSSFNAAAAPIAGPNWRRLANFNPTITAALISDASPAGRAMLTAADASAQLDLVDHLDITAGRYGDHPAFDRLYKETGGFVWLLKRVLQLSQVPIVRKPDAPVDGRVDDKGDTFSGTVKQPNPALGDYELFYPGSGGTVSAANGRADLVGTTLTIRDLVGINAPGTVGMRRAASGNIPASDWLTNVDAFTGVAPSPKGYQTLYTDSYPAAA